MPVLFCENSVKESEKCILLSRMQHLGRISTDEQGAEHWRLFCHDPPEHHLPHMQPSWGSQPVSLHAIVGFFCSIVSSLRAFILSSILQIQASFQHEWSMLFSLFQGKYAYKLLIWVLFNSVFMNSEANKALVRRYIEMWNGLMKCFLLPG